MTILYHYCSNAAFHSIVESRSIWLSALSLSSDTMEGKLVTSVIVEMAKSDGLDQADIQGLKESVFWLEQFVEGLGFCLSEKGDLLSQWRGYADDAYGVSIGFSKKYLEKLSDSLTGQELSFRPQKVEYEYESQKKLIQPTYEEIKGYIKQGAYKPLLGYPEILKGRTVEEIAKENSMITSSKHALSGAVLPLLFKFFLLKTKAFQEEQEWRLISTLVKGDLNCCFQPSLDKIIPHRKYPLSPLDENSIVKVILGPKNNTPNYVIDAFLKQNKFENVNVIRSVASYR